MWFDKAHLAGVTALEFNAKKAYLITVGKGNGLLFLKLSGL